MKSLGKDIQVHWFDAGHGSLSVEQNIHFQELMLRFAYRILNSKGFVTRPDMPFAVEPLAPGSWLDFSLLTDV